MAVDFTEKTGPVLHLSDVEANPKQHDERAKDPSKKSTASSRIEILCKTVAFLIVLCLFCVHLARVLREGKLTFRKVMIGVCLGVKRLHPSLLDSPFIKHILNIFVEYLFCCGTFWTRVDN